MTFPFFAPGFLNYPPLKREEKATGMRTWGKKEREWRGKSCGEILRRSGGQVCKPPPTQPGPWSAGQLVSRCHWSGGGAAGRVSERVKPCCKCRNCCHNKQLGQQLPPFLVVNATTAHAALVQPDERRREPGPLGGSLALGAGGGRPPMVGGWPADGSRSGMVSGGRGGRADAIRRNRPPAVTPPPLPLFPLSIASGPAGVLRAFLHLGKAFEALRGCIWVYSNQARPKETRPRA